VPLLLLLPLLFLALFAVWAVLLPLALWQRYRVGKARKRALRWVFTVNAWLLAASALFLFGSAAVLGFWVENALAWAAGGFACGLVAGLAGHALTRVEHAPDGIYFTPNRWIVLTLTLIVAARIAYGVVRAWQAWNSDDAGWWVQQGSLLAVAGLLVGYYLAYTLALRRRLPRR
jgi:hypothetical protein